MRWFPSKQQYAHPKGLGIQDSRIKDTSSELEKVKAFGGFSSINGSSLGSETLPQSAILFSKLVSLLPIKLSVVIELFLRCFKSFWSMILIASLKFYHFSLFIKMKKGLNSNETVKIIKEVKGVKEKNELLQEPGVVVIHQNTV